MNVIFTILNIIQLIVFIYLGISTLYIFIYAIAGIFNARQKQIKDDKQRKFAVMIPGYKEDAVIIDVCKDALNQDYPRELYDVIAICDSYQPETIEALKELPINVIEVSFDKSTKSKALNKTMELIENKYDVACILDADNLMSADFLTKMNEAFSKGYIAVQGHRVAKNLDTNFAILDAISEEVNNHIFRKGHRVLGMSSAIIGSGMSFEYQFFKDLMKTVNAIGGFDKEIDLKMMKMGVTIEYVPDALCYDEKVTKPEVFQHQRRRWLSAQVVYFKRYFGDAVKDLFKKGNFDYFNKAMHSFLFPRVLLIGFLFLIAASSFLYNPISYSLIWTGLFLLCSFTFLLSIPRKFYNKDTFIAVFSLPKGFFLMLMSLLKIKGANKKFLHTQHGQVDTKKAIGK